MPEGQFSMQFLSSSIDGTIKVWDLHTKLLPNSKLKSTRNILERTTRLNTYKSPLDIYNNRLMPTYTVKSKLKTI